jgi:cytochrome c553
MRRNFWTKTLIIALAMAASPAVLGQSVYNAIQQVEAIMADDELRQQAYEDGHTRIRFCGYCHGEDGNSKRNYIPNLADQHPLYLFKQFEKFGDGTREHYVMTKLAQTLTLEERINVAIYYSQQEAKSREADDPALAASGEPIYTRRCQACHGDKAEGFQDMPRLAGQPARYVREALQRFKDMEPGDDDSPMICIADPLSKEDIRKLAAYVQTL